MTRRFEQKREWKRADELRAIEYAREDEKDKRVLKMLTENEAERSKESKLKTN
jgi:hypothetical protein